jgi:hypothetical protein
VTIAAEQLQSLSGLCESLQVVQEGGNEYICLMKLKIRVGDSNHVVDAILCPGLHTGYLTRLFLSQPFPNKGANWSIHQILGRPWHSWSWQGVPADLPLLRMLLCHLDALK